MNILELKIKQATSGEKKKKSVIEIPGCNVKERSKYWIYYFINPVKGIMLPNFRKLVLWYSFQ
jgi:hypothetical protein